MQKLDMREATYPDLKAMLRNTRYTEYITITTTNTTVLLYWLKSDSTG